MKWQMPIGVDNFFDIRSKHYYFVDKTDFIRQLIDGHSAVTLITRPRRFGKTLTLSMLEYFFPLKKKYRAAISLTAWLSTGPGQITWPSAASIRLFSCLLKGCSRILGLACSNLSGFGFSGSLTNINFYCKVIS